MATTSARSERLALCDLMLECGPDAPTLCGDWTVRDLAAHLVVRERRPDAAAGLVVRAVARHGENVRLREALRPFEELIDRVRNGPPLLSPTRLRAVDALVNTVEFFVHHEDVRRAAPDWEPRPADPVLDADLRTALSRGARTMGRRSPCGLVLEPEGGARVVAKSGDPAVTLRGRPGELALFLFGRQAQARVEADGPADLVEAVRTAPFGI